MTKEYQPTRKEVFGEMVNEVKQYFSEDNLKNIGTKLKQIGETSLGMAEFTSLFPYVLPTTIRALKDAKTSLSGKTEFNPTYNVGFPAGFVGGIGLNIVQVMGYSYAVKQDNPEALLIPVVTNVASGVYEFGRSMYKNVRQRVLEKHKTEGLEATLQK